jgi:hypothetical protein
MGIITDTKATLKRCHGYGNQMKGLFSRHAVHNLDDLKRVAKDSTFQSEITALWGNILRAEGGAVTLTVILSTIAIAMGGVGIAVGGGAFGLPLLVFLAPAGYFAGQELDSEGYTKAVVNKFTKLLQIAQSLNFEEYTGVIAVKFKAIFGKTQELDDERHEGKKGDASS